MSRIKYIISQEEMQEILEALSRAKKLANFTDITQIRAFACVCAIDQAIDLLNNDKSEKPSEDHW